MSVEAITWALKQQIKPSSTKFVLVVLANCASGDQFIAWPSVGYLEDATGQDRKTVIKNLAALSAVGYIRDTGERRGATKQIPVWQLQDPVSRVEDDSEAKGTENGTVPFLDGNSTVFPTKGSQNSQVTVPFLGHGNVKKQKKETLGNNKSEAAQIDALDLPNWLPVASWEMWKAYRLKKDKKTYTVDAAQLWLKKLETLQAEGHDPVRVIEQSIESGWSGLFPTKGAHHGALAKAVTPAAKAATNDEALGLIFGRAHDDNIIDV